MIPEIRNHSYSQRLRDLNLISLEQRRLRGQLIEVFKYLRRLNNAQQEDFSTVTSMTEQEKMVNSNCERLQHINSPTFPPHQDNNHLECPTKLHSEQQNSEHIQEPPRPTLGTESHKCENHLLTMTFIM